VDWTFTCAFAFCVVHEAHANANTAAAKYLVCTELTMTSTALCANFKRHRQDLAAIQKSESAGDPLGVNGAGDDSEAVSPMTTLQLPVKSRSLQPAS